MLVFFRKGTKGNRDIGVTPTPAASHVDQPSTLALRRSPGDVVAGALAQLLDPPSWWRLRLLVDVVVLYLASSAALFADPRISGAVADRWLAAIFPLIVLAFVYAGNGRQDRLGGSLLDSTTHVLGAVSLAAMLTIGLASIAGGQHPVGMAVRLWLFGGVYLALARAVLLSVRRQAMVTAALATPTLVVGAGIVGEHVVRRLVDEPRYGLRPVGYLDSDPLPRERRADGAHVPVLGTPEDLVTAIEHTGAKRVILAFSSIPDHVLVSKVKECAQLGIEVSLVPRLFESINDRATLDHVGGLPLLTLHPTNPRGWQFAVKHGFDRLFAFTALVLLSPLMLACALAVRLSSPGPILFRQRRVGRDGAEFMMLKFRTMRGDPSQSGEADARWAAQIRGESAESAQSGIGTAGPPARPVSRTTSVGRVLRTLSMDELPQLLNVLRGDMSVVGPRPERVGYVREFERVVHGYGDRHRVRSGMTGWAQVNGLRGQTSIADRVEWDNYYIQNWSLGLDMRIIAMTVSEILRFRHNAYARVVGRSRRARKYT
jgi:exopolysaccharide biosynthesis polyprenyl glycosylphosphotransferase